MRVPKICGQIVDNDYTNKEDVAVDKEAIEFKNNDNDDQDNSDDVNGDDDVDNGNDNDDLYIEVTTTKRKNKRKKGVWSNPTTSRKRKSKGMTNASLNQVVRVMGMFRETQTARIWTTILICLRRKSRKNKNWTIHDKGRPGREIHPVPCTGPAEFFYPNFSDEELKGMVDMHGDICFH